MQLVTDPWQFEVIVATNLFGASSPMKWRAWQAGPASRRYAHAEAMVSRVARAMVTV
jgi:hypothetical protein